MVAHNKKIFVNVSIDFDDKALNWIYMMGKIKDYRIWDWIQLVKNGSWTIKAESFKNRIEKIYLARKSYRSAVALMFSFELEGCEFKSLCGNELLALPLQQSGLNVSRNYQGFLQREKYFILELIQECSVLFRLIIIVKINANKIHRNLYKEPNTLWKYVRLRGISASFTWKQCKTLYKRIAVPKFTNNKTVFFLLWSPLVSVILSQGWLFWTSAHIILRECTFFNWNENLLIKGKTV